MSLVTKVFQGAIGAAAGLSLALPMATPANAANAAPAAISDCNQAVMCMFQSDGFAGVAYKLFTEDSNFANNTYSDGTRANDRMRSYFNNTSRQYCFYTNSNFSGSGPFVVNGGTSGNFPSPYHDGISSARPC